MNRLLTAGEPAPWFHAPVLDGKTRYAFNTVGGRHILMLFAGMASAPGLPEAIALLKANHDLFDDANACFFGVTLDPQDVAQQRIVTRVPGIRWFLDYDAAVSVLFGAIAGEEYRPHWLLLDPTLRVVRIAGLAEGESVMAQLRALRAAPPVEVPAPVLVVPNVFEPALCAALIAQFEEAGGEDSGFMVEDKGITVLRTDYEHKRRADHVIQNKTLLATVRQRLHLNLRPMIQRAFQFDITHIERFLVARYDGQTQGHFRAHRDNTTKGTAHRRFACTINLNAEDYDGGDLSFPEYGPRTYRAPTGGAVVFSCGLLHEAQRVTRGQRYAFLPFFYDAAAAEIRQQNLAFVAEGVGGGQATDPGA